MQLNLHWYKYLGLFCQLGLVACGTTSVAPLVKDVPAQAPLADYRAAEAEKPLEYVATASKHLPGVEKRSYTLTSQHWSAGGMVTPIAWQHEVDIYIPEQALSGTALLVVNNGINTAGAGGTVKGPSDFSETVVASIAKRTRSIVISVSNVPNQYLTYADDGIARREDSSVAHSWKLFLQAPQQRPFMSLHIPMMEAVVKTMDLSEQVLQPWHIHHFIVTGASKRAWATWLAAIADTRVQAVVPFVLDILNMGQVLDHTYQVYGKSWPLAFRDYQGEGITVQRHSASFDQLLDIEDPMRYLGTAQADRLAIPKYIVNASGDDFFVPDNARYSFAALPGVKALRVVPNSSHYGIISHVEETLVPLVNRLQQARPLPTVSSGAVSGVAAFGESVSGEAGPLSTLTFSEMPVKVMYWQANNPNARDFRYACGVRYEGQVLVVDAARQVVVPNMAPKEIPVSGWTASFVEAEFADGFVVTTQVRVLPDTYPDSPPPVLAPGCQTLPDAAPQ